MARQRTRYFVSSRTGDLLRRDHDGDWVLTPDGAWARTETILNYMTGRDDDIDEVSEEQARALLGSAAGGAALEI